MRFVRKEKRSQKGCDIYVDHWDQEISVSSELFLLADPRYMRVQELGKAKFVLFDVANGSARYKVIADHVDYWKCQLVSSLWEEEPRW